jgi:signal transduction histidine kinase
VTGSPTTLRGELLARLVAATESERRQIADEIHDEPVQEIAAAALRLQILRRQLGDPGHFASLDSLDASLDAAIDWLRGIMFELRPPGDEGLEVVLRTYLGEAEHRSGIRHRFDGSLSREPKPITGVLLYRLAQEALINARSHEGAAEVALSVAERDDGYDVSVTDDGESAGDGPHLELARRRVELLGGTLKVDAGAGTVVRIWVPDLEGEAGA